MTKYSPQNAVQAQPRQSGGRFGSHKTAAPEAATSAPTPALDGTAKREPPQPWQEALVLYQLSPALYAPPAHQLVSIGLTPEQARARSRVLAKDAPFYNLRRFVLTSNQPDTLAELIATDAGERALVVEVSSHWKVTGLSLVAALEAQLEPF